MIAGHPYPPHLWYQPATRALYQTVPFERHAFALERPDGAIATNAACALQVEIGGRAAETPNWPDEWLTNIAEDVIVPMCRFVASRGGSIDLLDTPEPGAIGGSASSSAPQRMSVERWRNFRGICGHRHVPSNEHWDPGALNVDRIAAHAALIIGQQLVDVGYVPQQNTLKEEPEMRACQMNDDQILLVDGLTFRVIPKPWEYQNAVLVELARANLIPSGPGGVPIIEKIGDNAVRNLIQVGA
jgi:hypothetical protein